MRTNLIVALAIGALTGVAQAQTTDRNAGDAARDTADKAGAAARAAVTPGDQNMGRTPNNRTGGVMGTDRPTGAAITPGDQNMGRDPNNRSGGLMGTDRTGAITGPTSGGRPARADRG